MSNTAKTTETNEFENVPDRFKELATKLKEKGVAFQTFATADEDTRKRVLKEKYSELREQFKWAYDQRMSLTEEEEKEAKAAAEAATAAEQENAKKAAAATTASSESKKK